MRSQRDLIYGFFNGGRRLLIVLDACNYRAFMEKIDLLGNFAYRLTGVLSSACCTSKWLEKTFTEPINAVYVTANPWVPLLLRDKGIMKKIHDVSSRFWDERLGTVRAEHVNMIALKYMMKGENVIVHYLQPHPPFISNTWLKGDDPPELAGRAIYEKAIRDGKARREFVKAYKDNLAYALKNARRLIQLALKLGYKVVLTSDHSELLGIYAPLKTFRWLFRKHPIKLLKAWLPYSIGLYRVVGHPCNWKGKELLEVPWVEVYA